MKEDAIVAVGLTRDSWPGMLGGPAILLALSVYQLFLRPPSFGSFGFVLGAAGLFAVINLLRARALLDRACPGLDAMASRLARGSLYVQAPSG